MHSWVVRIISSRWQRQAFVLIVSVIPPSPSRLLTFGTFLCSWWVLPAHRSKAELLHAAQQGILHTAVLPASATAQGHCQRRRHFAQSMFIGCDTEHGVSKELQKKTAAAAPLITFPQTSTVIYNLDDVTGTKYDLDRHTDLLLTFTGHVLYENYNYSNCCCGFGYLLYGFLLCILLLLLETTEFAIEPNQIIISCYKHKPAGLAIRNSLICHIKTKNICDA